MIHLEPNINLAKAMQHVIIYLPTKARGNKKDYLESNQREGIEMKEYLRCLREGLKWKARSGWARAAAGLVKESPTQRSSEAKGHAQIITTLFNALWLKRIFYK